LKVVVCRHDDGDVIEIEPGAIYRRSGKMVLVRMTDIGTARVPRRAPATNAVQFSHDNKMSRRVLSRIMPDFASAAR